MKLCFYRADNIFLIGVFVTDSDEDAEKNEKLIAGIANETWNYFTK